MLLRSSAMALAASALLAATALAANDYAEKAAQVANAIQTGDTDAQRQMMPGLSEVEYAEIGKLAGCTGTINPGGGSDFVLIDWRCGKNAVEPELARSTAMFFDDKGTLNGFSINQPLERLGSGASEAEYDGERERELLRDLGEAVVSGGDATLGGRLDVDSFDAARLAQFEGGRFRLTRRRLAGSFRLILTESGARGSERRALLLERDEEGSPRSLIFTPTYFPSDTATGSGDSRLNRSAGRDGRAVNGRCVIC